MRGFTICTLPTIIRGIKSRRMRWVRCVAHMGEKMHTKLYLENLHRKQHFGDLAIDGSI
jgi:hypothetical protein